MPTTTMRNEFMPPVGVGRVEYMRRLNAEQLDLDLDEALGIGRDIGSSWGASAAEDEARLIARMRDPAGYTRSANARASTRRE